jgi:hypothetical protein
VTELWATGAGWSIEKIERQSGVPNLVTITVLGADPSPDLTSLRSLLDDQQLAYLNVRIRLVPEKEVFLPSLESD